MTPSFITLLWSCEQIKQPATLPTLTGHNVVCRLQQDNNCIILIQPGQMKIHKDIIQRCISMMEEDLGTDQCFVRIYFALSIWTPMTNINKLFSLDK